jgi:hypothetical protein
LTLKNKGLSQGRDETENTCTALQALVFTFFVLLIFAAAGAGLTGFKMARRTGGIKEFQFEPIGENHQQGASLFFSS